MILPEYDELSRGIEEYVKNERRDPVYKVATNLVSDYWPDPVNVTDGLGVLLLIWNQAFYRYGSLDFNKLEQCIKTNIKKIKIFRNRDILSLKDSDEKNIVDLFDQFLDALKRDDGKNHGTKSPVSVSKALHLLAPNFFPLWDIEISKAYGCFYNKNPDKQYIQFCYIMKEMVSKMKTYKLKQKRPVLKLIDEYNYSKFTKHWI